MSSPPTPPSPPPAATTSPPPGTRWRFRGRIAGVGTTSGVRVVVGWWHHSPFGAFADAMVERADGHRILLAPTNRVAELVAGTYVFDEIRVQPFSVDSAPDPLSGWPASAASGGDAPARGGGAAYRWEVRSPSLQLTLRTGPRMPLGRLLRLVPAPIAASPAWAGLVDPVARVMLRGVRTRGTAQAGRVESYGATDLHAIVAATGELDGVDLGALAPVDPPCRFGFSSTPRRPSVTDVVTTIEFR